MKFIHLIVALVFLLPQFSCSSADKYSHLHYSKKLYQCAARCRGPKEGCIECSGPCSDSCATFRFQRACPKIPCLLGSYYCSCEEGYKRHPISKKCILACQCPETHEYDYVNEVAVKGKIRSVEWFQEPSNGDFLNLLTWVTSNISLNFQTPSSTAVDKMRRVGIVTHVLKNVGRLPVIKNAI